MLPIAHIFRRKNFWLLPVVVAGMIIIGIRILTTSHAATDFIAVEAEQGAVSGSASVATDSIASAGKAVLFGNSPEVSVDSFGAKGDGLTDDTTAIQQTFDSLKAGQTAVFTTGKTYNHAAVLRLTIAGTTVRGNATLQATNEAASTLAIAADNVRLSDLTLKMKATTRRWSAPAQTMVYLEGHAYDSVLNVTVDGSPSAGIFSLGAHDYLIQDVDVKNTRADAIHNTGGSYNAQIVRPTIRNVGDDGVAIVSYAADGAICHDITVTSPRFYGSTNGRAYSVVGGNTISFNDIYAESSNAASIYIGSEGSPYYTYGTDTITVRGGTIKNANTNASVDHGAILVLGSQSTMLETNINISDIAISDTRADATRQVSILDYAGAMSKIQLTNINVTGGGNLFGVYQLAGASYNTIGWTFNGSSIPDHRGF